MSPCRSVSVSGFVYTQRIVPHISSVEVFINIQSGLQPKEDLPRQLQQLFAQSGVAAGITIMRNGSEVEKSARDAIHSSSPLIVVGGGDGTLSTFASIIVSSGAEKVLGVLPLGTLNHFAQDLHIPPTLVDAVRVVLAGYQTRIDVGEVNGRIFINNSSLGLYPQIVRERVKQQRLGHGKWPAFIWAAWTVFRRYPFVEVRLVVAREQLNCRTPFVFIGNNPYSMEAFSIGRRERLDAGILSLYITKRAGRWGLIRLALRALFGHLRNEKDFVVMTTDHVKIESRRRRHRLRVAFDGEVDVLEPPLQYRVRPGALRVIVPEEAPE